MDSVSREALIVNVLLISEYHRYVKISKFAYLDSLSVKRNHTIRLSTFVRLETCTNLPVRNPFISLDLIIFVSNPLFSIERILT